MGDPFLHRGEQVFIHGCYEEKGQIFIELWSEQKGLIGTFQQKDLA
mgnify:CR=1 FL=1